MSPFFELVHDPLALPTHSQITILMKPHLFPGSLTDHLISPIVIHSITHQRLSSINLEDKVHLKDGDFDSGLSTQLQHSRPIRNITSAQDYIWPLTMSYLCLTCESFLLQNLARCSACIVGLLYLPRSFARSNFWK